MLESLFDGETLLGVEGESLEEEVESGWRGVWVELGERLLLSEGECTDTQKGLRNGEYQREEGTVSLGMRRSRRSHEGWMHFMKREKGRTECSLSTFSS